MCSVVWGSNHNSVSARTEQTGKPCFSSSGKKVTSTVGNKARTSPWFGIRIRGIPTSSWFLICVQINGHRMSTPCISSSVPWDSPGAMAPWLSGARPAPPHHHPDPGFEIPLKYHLNINRRIGWFLGWGQGKYKMSLGSLWDQKVRKRSERVCGCGEGQVCTGESSQWPELE